MSVRLFLLLFCSLFAFRPACDLLPADGAVFGVGGLPDGPAIEVVIPLGINLTYTAEGFAVRDGNTYVFRKGTGLVRRE